LSSARRDLLWATILAAALFLPGLGARDLWNPDEPRYAEVAREMRLSGNYLVPHLNGEVYSHKPPLQFWAMCGAALLRGRLDETAARLPAALAAILATLLLLDLGRRLFNRRAAWIAVAAFLTGSKVLWQGRIGQIDMLLVTLVLLAVWCWLVALRENRPGLALVGFVATGLATIAKGPVGLLPPLLGLLAFLLWTRDRTGFRRLFLGRGLLLWVATVLAWLIPAAVRGGTEYLQQIAFRQTVTRYADPWHHFQPPWYYLTVLPADFFPWILLLPAALFAAWRGLAGEERRAARFALCWVAVTLLFFSVSPAKRTVYILTMYPGLALLVGAGLDQLAVRWPRERNWFFWPLAACAGLFATAAALLPSQVERRAELAALGENLVPWLVGLVLALAAAFALAAWLGYRGRIAAAVGALASGMGAVAVTAVLFVLPRFDAVKSARQLSATLLAEAAPNEPYGIYPRLDATFLFYSERFSTPLENEQALRAFVARDERVWLLAQRDDLAKLADLPPLHEVARDADIREGYLLLTNRAR
jgi:4-amino-4-deoxy-L-arabinose transferase-like glycosyltransferase